MTDLSPRTAACLAVTAAFASLAVPSARAQVTVTDDYNFRGEVCVGFSCPDASYTGDDGIRMIESIVRFLVEDTSVTSGYPGNDWRLVFNDAAQYGLNYFAIEDVDTGLMPFMVQAGAPANALRVAPSGNVGFGTAFPTRALHVVGGTLPSLRLEQDNSDGNGYMAWEMTSDNFGLSFNFDSAVSGGDTRPVLIRPSADYTLVVHNNGVGVGAYLPQAMLHVQRADGSAKLLVEETFYETSPRTLLSLQNNGRPEIVMGNTDTGGEWSFGAGTNFILKQGAVGSASNAKTKLFEVDPSGNATLTGTLTTGGPSCAGGCDAVFDPDYALPSIADHAAQMFALGHLPNVGPTRPGQPFNVSEQYGRLLNELEHAHIYIARQDQRMAQMQAEIDALKAARD
ncbi:MAG: hypothetical protein R3D85_17250 [Paracoccaceae bacterium]